MVGMERLDRTLDAADLPENFPINGAHRLSRERPGVGAREMAQDDGFPLRIEEASAFPFFQTPHLKAQRGALVQEAQHLRIHPVNSFA